MMYRPGQDRLEVLLVHPGGPYWASKDLGAWSIPKGEIQPGEAALEAAKREFEEETGFVAGGDFIDLGEIRQAGGKVVKAWAFAGDCDPAALVSNQFELEWPPRSGHLLQFPEVDRAGWFSIDRARAKILKGQLELLDRLSAAFTPER